MKVSYQNHSSVNCQQKQEPKGIRSYIIQAAARGATEEELDILCQAYLLEQKYRLAVNSMIEYRPPVRRIYDVAVFDNRVEAEKVYRQMLEFSTQYGAVSVNDYYELCGLEDKILISYELKNYGWTKDAVLNMSVVQIGTNYMIDVPRTVQCFLMKGENHA